MFVSVVLFNLAYSLLFKFFLAVNQKLEAANQTSEKLPDTYKSGPECFKTLTPKSSQYFQVVSCFKFITYHYLLQC